MIKFRVLGQLVIAVLALGMASCKKGGASSAEANYTFDAGNESTTTLYSIIDKRETEALVKFFKHENPNLRYLAAMAFASMEDSTHTQNLLELLKDPDKNVRSAAVLALGLNGNKDALKLLVDAFKTMEGDTLRDARPSILEAVGRLGTNAYLNKIATAPGYANSNTPFLKAQANSILYYALRDSVSVEGTNKMIELFTALDVSETVKLVAAYYLHRTPNLILQGKGGQLMKALGNIKSPQVRLFAVTAVAKSQDTAIVKPFRNLYYSEKDDRVKISLLRAFKHLPYDSVKYVAFNALKESNPHVQQTAAEYLYNHGTAKDAAEYLRLANEQANLPWRTQIKLKAAALHTSSSFQSSFRQQIINGLTESFKTETNEYKKAAYLEALGAFSWNYVFIRQQFDSTATKLTPIVSTAAINTLVGMLKDPIVSQQFGFSIGRFKQELSFTLFQLITKKNTNALPAAAEAINSPELNYKQYLPDHAPLALVRDQLNPILDMETFLNLDKAIKSMGGVSNKKAVVHNNPSSFNALKNLSASPKMVVETSKGKITIEFMLNKAPMTIANLVTLVQAGFYTNKTFHRVVPNFVIQTGCNRGDGFGGFDKSIRSEISDVEFNQEGYVGMASAGKDTEATQWFITQAPALHLNGRYTIFGKVTDGMDVVQKIEIGDKIIKAEIQ